MVKLCSQRPRPEDPRPYRAFQQNPAPSEFPQPFERQRIAFCWWCRLCMDGQGDAARRERYILSIRVESLGAKLSGAKIS